MAVLEAFWVLPCLGFFFGAMPFGYRLFASWYEVQSGTRNRALSAASRGCATGGDTIDVGGSTDETRRVASKKGEPAAVRATDPTLGLVAQADSRTVGFGPLSRTVRAASFGTCNEPAGDLGAEPNLEGWSEFGFEQHQGAR